jgi:Mg2+-importing ATPase
MLTSAIIMGVGVLLPHTDLASSLGFTGLPPLYWPILLATLLCYIFLTQAVKTFLFRKQWI